MAKKKDATALFEVISKTREKRSSAGLDVPAWMGPPGSTAPTAENPSQAAPPPVPAAVEPTPVPEPPPSLPPIGETDAAMEPLVRTTGGRLRLSLNYVSCMVIFIGMVLVLVGAFALGRYTAEKTTPAALGDGEGPVEQAGVQPPVEQPEQKEEPPMRLPPPTAGWMAGKYYLIVQLTSGKSAKDKENAEKMVKFLGEKGVPAAVNDFRVSGQVRYGVWSLTPFDSSQSPEALAFAHWIEDKLGAEYFAKNSDYKFQQRLKPGGAFQPWFVAGNQQAGTP